ncbi:MAG: thioredoxin TrxA [Ectothiorhodospiraceae bacterium]|nr:thioredoxin TrxA [Ectothiorhodospiraceae bacterium]
MSNDIVHATEPSFEAEVLKADGPVLVDYWAEWCGPCKMLAPILDDVAAEYRGKVKVVKVNIDESRGLAPKYGIRGIPTLMIFEGGDVKATRVGALSRPELQEFVSQNA